MSTDDTAGAGGRDDSLTPGLTPASRSHSTGEISAPSRANRLWWDSDADDYHARHPEYLGGDSSHGEFHWCPEMLHEADLRLLGTPAELSGATVLELGCGSAPCARWLAADLPDTLVTGFDISREMLRHAGPDHRAHLAQADMLALPYRSGSMDVVFSVFGALPFVREEHAALREVSRVLRPGGRFVFSVNHPMRWIFPDDPQEFTAAISYFAREYEEHDENGQLTYAEYHRTFGDWIRAINDSDLRLLDVIEPEWPAHLTRNWGQWSPERGRIFPGTAIFSCERN